MADEKNLKLAKNVYNSLCEMLDEKNVRYDKDQDDLIISFITGGDDIPMQFLVKVDAERELIRVLSPIPVTFGEEKRVEGAIATCHATYTLADGSFDYDFQTGKVLFRLTSSYMDSLISKNLFEYMIIIAIHTVDKYNDKFFMLAKGQMSIEEFCNQE